MNQEDVNAHSELYFNRLKAALDSIDRNGIARLIEIIERGIGSEKTFFVVGNGGSASTSSHMVCDLGKTILGKDPKSNEKRLRIISLNENVALMTAWGNDDSYDVIFSEQLKNLGREGDILIIITGSGNSKNIIQAVEEAKKRGMETFGLLGFNGGKAKEMLDNYILVSSFDYGVVEDAHMIVNHLVTDWFKSKM